ncbi:trimeric LpxA-like protein [Podospora appendiculata]|uniref:Trimeric LpxA-like protein n=1 Tax=Podospora appendiculata TaxID=314037 RepID=A0AAE0XCI4_9PEZI|nr:trimeric LpxA-like protein [Podospora appendiculata]
MAEHIKMDLTNTSLQQAAPADHDDLGIIFPAGNDDFRAARDRCAQACRRFNNTPEDASPDVRSSLWLDIVRPARDLSSSAEMAITHDMTFRNPALKARTPFVKPPFYADYGLRVRIAGSTFINRGCMIMDTPVADVVVGEGCNIGPNCCFVSVSHPSRPEERIKTRTSTGKGIVLGDNVFVGANVTILGGVTIGDGAVIGAGSVVTKSIPAYTMAAGVPARLLPSPPASSTKSDELFQTEVTRSVSTLAEAMIYSRAQPLDRKEELELARLSSSLLRAQQLKLKHQQIQSQPQLLGDSRGQQQQLDDCRGGAVPDARDGNGSGLGRGSVQSQPRMLWRLFRPEVMIIVAGTSVAFAMLVSFFLAGVLVGAKRFAIIEVDQPRRGIGIGL